MLTTLSLILLAFFFASISSGELVAELHGVNLRDVGSGNTGATNVYRAMGRGAAVLTGALDAFKGLLPVLLGRMAGLSVPGLSLVALTAVLGHCYSPYLGLRGGKGVATSLGAALVLTPLPALVAMVSWIGLMSALHTASIASMVGALVLPVVAALHPASRPFVPVLLLLLGLILLRHRENLRRLSSGHEFRFHQAPELHRDPLVSTDEPKPPR